MGDASAATAGKSWFVAVGLLALLIGGFIGIHWLKKPPTQPNVDEGRAVAEHFLANVRTGKAGEAWDSGTTELKSIEGRESFIRKARSTPILTGALQFNSSVSKVPEALASGIGVAFIALAMVSSLRHRKT